jgi:hypothetical protein
LRKIILDLAKQNTDDEGYVLIRKLLEEEIEK